MAFTPTLARAIVGAALSLGAAPVSAQNAAPAPAPQAVDQAAQRPDDVAANPPVAGNDSAMSDVVDGMTVTEAVAMLPMSELPPDIIVTGSRVRRRTSETASGAVLAGPELETQIRSTIGETLAHLPGASSTSFGPSASRPVLRGFQGERARILIDGIGTLDASNTSPDHAVALNPLVADRIEVLRGPVSLLYASGSLGGVINSVSGRIARKRPSDGVDAVVSGSFGSAADEATAGVRLDIATGPRLVLHFDGQYINAGSVDTGGFIIGPAPRAEASRSPFAGISALANLRGTLPNTYVETWEAAGGASLVFDNGHIGFSAADYESVYGLPTRFSFDPSTPVPDTLIDLDQKRIDARFEFDLNGIIDTIRGRFGWADYLHNEVEVGGPISATFINKAYESRLEAVFGGKGRWKATLGGQYYDRDFRVTGPAPLLPPNRTAQFGLFTLHEFDLARIKFEGSVRYEHVAISSEIDPILANPLISRDFDTWSFAGGANVGIINDWKIALNLSYQQRAPVVEELFTQGVDPGTQGQLIGNPSLGLETSFGIEAVLHGGGPGYTLTASAYYTRFPNFIFARESGATVDGLPVFQFLENGARYYGFEAQGSVDLARLADWKITADGLVDYTDATLDNGAPVPRIPPLRVLIGAGATTPTITARAEVEWVMPQTRISLFETPTRGFAMVNLQMGWRPFGEGSPFQLRVTAANVLNTEGRRHASLLKDFAPLPGRDIRLSVKYRF